MRCNVIDFTVGIHIGISGEESGVLEQIVLNFYPSAETWS